MALNSSGAYVSVWKIMEPKSDACISVLCSNSAKKKATGTYKEEFNGFITFIGEANRKIRSYPYEPSTDPSTGKRAPITRLFLTEFSVTGGNTVRDENGYAKKDDAGNYIHEPIRLQCYDFRLADEARDTSVPSAEPTTDRGFMNIPDGIDEELPFS